MIKEVRYNGYAAQPSEYSSQDGDLAVAMNLVPEDGGLKVVSAPDVILGLSEGKRALYVHRSSQYKHILYSDSDGVYWAEMSETDNSFEEDSELKVMSLAENEQVRGIVAIGNTLIITTSEAMRYVLWRDEKYIDLGSKLPFVGIEFDMRKQGEISRTVEAEFTEMPRGLGNSILERVEGEGSISGGAGYTEANAYRKITESVYGTILELASEKITTKGYFYQPMMVRYALKMYDGAYIMHSMPVLLMPTVCVPSAQIIKAEGSDATLKTETETTIAYYALQYRILGNVDISEWNDLIDSVDIFVSAPIYTWNQAKDINDYPGELQCLSRSLYPFDRNDFAPPENIFAGHHDGEDYYVPYRSTGYWRVRLNSKWDKEVVSEHLFYKLHSIPFDKIKEMEGFEDVELENEDLTALETFPTLPDDYNSHSGYVGEFQYAYNNRLNIANVEYFAGDTLPIRTMGAYVKPADGVGYVPLTVDVWIKKEGKEIVATQTINAEASESNPFAWANVAMSGATFPRWMFYPDAGAYKMRVRGDGWNVRFYLTPHDYLNGAYWWGGLGLDVDYGEPPIVPAPGIAVKANSVILGNKLYTSEAENPWVFPASGVRAIGDGDITGIASAAMALSEGQFGQFPLYAFTTEGVWALSVTDTGTFNPAQPISRDVCVDADSITQIDQAVLFATDRGVMMIAGSETMCMTDGIDTDSAMLLKDMPGGESLIGLAHLDDKAFDILPFAEFLRGVRMVYDYTHQRIYLYNGQVRYAYVYSLKTKQWGMMASDIMYGVNSYPEALVVTSENKLVDLSSAAKDAMREGLMVTRALKFDGADILKSVEAVIQRGYFDRGDVGTVLWGSRDLKHWHLVWTSKDHYLRGFRGTPYKYYRIGAVTRMRQDERLVGASVQLEPRETNRLR